MPDFYRKTSQRLYGISNQELSSRMNMADVGLANVGIWTLLFIHIQS